MVFEMVTDKMEHSVGGMVPVYGIQVRLQGKNLYHAPALSTCREAVVSFAALCEDSDVSVFHIWDVMEDFVAERSL